MTESLKIARLPGGIIPEGGCLNRDVIRFLDELKEMALNGEIKMIAATWINGAGEVTNDWTEGTGRLSLIAGTLFLQKDLMDG